MEDIPDVVVGSSADGKPKNQSFNELHDKDCEGLTTTQAESLHAKYGYNEVKAKQTPEWKKIAWRYLDWVSLVIIAAAIISIAVPNNGDRGYLSFSLLIFELNIIVWVGWYTDHNAGNAVKELEELAAPTAVCQRDGEWREIAVRELVPTDVIALKGGDIVPADCVLLGPGEPLKLDESSLTGESLSTTKKPGDRVLSGTVVEHGELHARVVAIGSETFFGKTMLLLGIPEERGHLQKVLGRVSVLLGVIGLFGVVVIFGVIMGRGDNGTGYALVTAFVVLVSTVPIGMPVVVGAVLAVGARHMAKERAIVSRLSALEELSGMEVLCSDKTGTLTLNNLTLDESEVEPWGEHTKEKVLEIASLSAKWSNQDAIDRAITSSVGGDKSTALAGWKITRMVPFNPVDKKTIAEAITPEGESISAAKGAPQIIGDLLKDPKAREFVNSYVDERASRGLRSLGVAWSKGTDGDWELVGLISLLDPPRPDSAETIKSCRHDLGVEVKMITGDQYAIAVETCRRLGMGTDILSAQELTSGQLSDDIIQKVEDVDGFAGVYPEHKFRIVEAFQTRGTLVGMTGDGVNDAPALKRANVGIAVSGATSAAKGAADIILTEPGISTIVTAIRQSRKIFRRLETYIAYRLASSLIILFFFLLSIVILEFSFPTWTLVLVSLTNDLSVMATSLDKVHSSDLPQTWNMTRQLLVASALASVNTGMLVLLLLLADPSRLNFWPWWNQELSPDTGSVEGTTSAQTNAIMYLGLTLFIQLQILLTRNHSFWWHFGPNSAPRPSLLLLFPVVFFTVGATFIAVYWPISAQPDGGIAAIDGAGWVPCLVVWFYAFIWLNVADVAKYCVQRLFRRYDLVKEDCKRHGTPLPRWIRILDKPGDWGDNVADFVESCRNSLVNTFSKLCHVAPKKNELKHDTPLTTVGRHSSSF